MERNPGLEIAVALDLNRAIVGEKNAKTESERAKYQKIAKHCRELIKKIEKGQNTR